MNDCKRCGHAYEAHDTRTSHCRGGFAWDSRCTRSCSGYRETRLGTLHEPEVCGQVTVIHTVLASSEATTNAHE